MQEWEWPDSAGGTLRAGFAGDLCISTLVNKIKKFPRRYSAWQSQMFATIV